MMEVQEKMQTVTLHNKLCDLNLNQQLNFLHDINTSNVTSLRDMDKWKDCDKRRASSQSNYFRSIPSTAQIAMYSQKLNQNLMMIKSPSSASNYMNQGLTYGHATEVQSQVRNRNLSQRQQMRLQHYKSCIKDFGGSNLQDRKYISISDYIQQNAQVKVQRNVMVLSNRTKSQNLHVNNKPRPKPSVPRLNFTCFQTDLKSRENNSPNSLQQFTRIFSKTLKFSSDLDQNGDGLKIPMSFFEQLPNPHQRKAILKLYKTTGIILILSSANQHFNVDLNLKYRQDKIRLRDFLYKAQANHFLVHAKYISERDEDEDTLYLPDKAFHHLHINPGHPACITIDLEQVEMQQHLFKEHHAVQILLEPLQANYMEYAIDLQSDSVKTQEESSIQSKNEMISKALERDISIFKLLRARDVLSFPKNKKAYEFEVKNINGLDESKLYLNYSKIKVTMIIEDFKSYHVAESTNKPKKVTLDLDLIFQQKGLDIYEMQKAINEFNEAEKIANQSRQSKSKLMSKNQSNLNTKSQKSVVNTPTEKAEIYSGRSGSAHSQTRLRKRNTGGIADNNDKFSFKYNQDNSFQSRSRAHTIAANYSLGNYHSQTRKSAQPTPLQLFNERQSKREARIKQAEEINLSKLNQNTSKMREDYKQITFENADESILVNERQKEINALNNLLIEHERTSRLLEMPPTILKQTASKNINHKQPEIDNSLDHKETREPLKIKLEEDPQPQPIVPQEPAIEKKEIKISVDFEQETAMMKQSTLKILSNSSFQRNINDRNSAASIPISTNWMDKVMKVVPEEELVINDGQSITNEQAPISNENLITIVSTQQDDKSPTVTPQGMTKTLNEIIQGSVQVSSQSKVILTPENIEVNVPNTTQKIVISYEQMVQMFCGDVDTQKLKALHWYDAGSVADKRIKTYMFEPAGQSPRGANLKPVVCKGVFEKQEGIWSIDHSNLNKYRLPYDFQKSILAPKDTLYVPDLQLQIFRANFNKGQSGQASDQEMFDRFKKFLKVDTKTKHAQQKLENPVSRLLSDCIMRSQEQAQKSPLTNLKIKEKDVIQVPDERVSDFNERQSSMASAFEKKHGNQDIISELFGKSKTAKINSPQFLPINKEANLKAHQTAEVTVPQTKKPSHQHTFSNSFKGQLIINTNITSVNDTKKTSDKEVNSFIKLDDQFNNEDETSFVDTIQIAKQMINSGHVTLVEHGSQVDPSPSCSPFLLKTTQNENVQTNEYVLEEPQFTDFKVLNKSEIVQLSHTLEELKEILQIEAKKEKTKLHFVPATWRPCEQTLSPRTSKRLQTASPAAAHVSAIARWQLIKNNFDKVQGGELSSVKNCAIYGKQIDKRLQFIANRPKSSTYERVRKPHDRRRIRNNLTTLCEGDYSAYNHHNPSIPVVVCQNIHLTRPKQLQQQKQEIPTENTVTSLKGQPQQIQKLGMKFNHIQSTNRSKNMNLNINSWSNELLM